MTKRKICVVTGTRAEYGLLYWLMKEIQADDDLELQLVVTGMHLSPEFGLTYKQIEEDGFRIDEKVEMLVSADTPSAIAKSLGLGTIGFADIFSRLNPDLLVLLGDRFEALAAAQTAMIHRIPIAHISGGEVTEGVIDESIRHAITKMSHLHLTANEEYRQRVIQLGEQPHRAFNVGDPGVENIKRMKFISKEELVDVFGLHVTDFFLITFHPATLEYNTAEQQITNLLHALDQFPGYQLIFTKSNADTGGRRINELIDEYVAKNKTKARAVVSLGQLRYLSALKLCSIVIGNSSSGIVEAPVFAKPTVNIGDRQKGRLKASSIIDCEPDVYSIVEAINKAISKDFQMSITKVDLKYSGSEVSKKIKQILKTCSPDEMLKKSFYDIRLL